MEVISLDKTYYVPLTMDLLNASLSSLRGRRVKEI